MCKECVKATYNWLSIALALLELAKSVKHLIECGCVQVRQLGDNVVLIGSIVKVHNLANEYKGYK